MSEEITTREEYYPNGNLCFRINYKDGKGHGLCEWWSENGNLESRYNYKNGKLYGLCEEWNYDGTIWAKEYYFNGIEITEFEYDVLKTCGEFEDEYYNSTTL